MKWLLIRHGQTQGNLEHRYIGSRTDEPLCAQGVRALKKLPVPAVQRVFSSPMKRCLETAAILYPGIPAEVVDDFRECDFGAFENKNHAELNGRADYQAWIDSSGEMPFPGGESRALFAERCVKAFAEIRMQPCDCALIAHGGTLMSIMAAYARPAQSYYHFQVQNGEGFCLHEDGTYHTFGLTQRTNDLIINTTNE